MKKILVMSVALSSFSAFADWTLKNEKDIYDLMQISSKGKITSETVYTSLSTEDRTLPGKFTISHSNSAITENFNFGIIEGMEIGLGFGYQLSDETKLKLDSSLGGTTSTYKEKGITSPSFNTKYRLMNQELSYGNSDILLSYSPKIGTSKDAVEKVDGNALRDSSLLIAELDFGRKYSDMAWRLGFTGSFYGSGRSQDADAPTSTTTSKSYSDILFDGAWQWLFSSKYILNLNLGLGNLSDISTTTSSGMTSVEKKKSYTVFGVDGKYLLNKETLLALNLSSKSYDKSNWLVSGTNIPTGVYSDTSIKFSVKTEF